MGLVAVLAVCFTFGPQLMDLAWDNGTHVTPAQALLHAMLESQGITHHHHHLSSLPGRQVASTTEGSSHTIDAGSPSVTFGSPFLQLNPGVFGGLLRLMIHHIVFPDQSQPPSVVLAPTPPPPRPHLLAV